MACWANLPEILAISTKEWPDWKVEVRSTASSMALMASLKATAALLNWTVSNLLTSLMMSKCYLFWIRLSSVLVKAAWVFPYYKVQALS